MAKKTRTIISSRIKNAPRSDLYPMGTKTQRRLQTVYMAMQGKGGLEHVLEII